MTYFNPLIAPITGGAQTQKSAADKERQVARAQALAKNSAAEADRFEHTVESADALARVGEDPARGGQQQKPQKQSPRPDEETNDQDPGETHLDVTG